MNALLGDPPAAIITATIWIYWLCVGFMIVRARRQKHDLAGLVPEKRFERALWLILVPVIVAWIVLPWLANCDKVSLRACFKKGTVPVILGGAVPFLREFLGQKSMDRGIG